MAFKLSKTMILPIMLLNFILYFISAAIAGSILNRNLDSDAGTNVNPAIGNVVTPIFISIALVASVVGLASVLAGAHHVRVWRTESLAAAAATTLIAWLLTLLAMGLAAKEVHTQYGRSKRLKALEFFIFTLSVTELLYLLSLYAGNATREGYANQPGRNVNDPKYGTPAATAV